mgnify:CR=1 FL=1
MAQQTKQGAKAKPAPLTPQPTPKEKATDERHNHATD